MSFLDRLDPKYELILCDVWGCVHDGVSLYPGVVERLRAWREEGRTIVLISNAPRTVEAVERQLGRVGLPRDCWDALATSGEAGIAALKPLGPVGFIGTAGDREILEGKGVRIAEDEDFTDLACTGLDGEREDPGAYEEQLRRLAARNVTMHCLNPDRVVVSGGAIIACAGALADMYETMAGRVIWYGKPYPAIYEHALSLAGNPPTGEVLAIGDGLQTDVLGAARMGFDCVFVTGGIHEGEPFPPDFGARHELGDWQPAAVVDSLG